MACCSILFRFIPYYQANKSPQQIKYEYPQPNSCYSDRCRLYETITSVTILGCLAWLIHELGLSIMQGRGSFAIQMYAEFPITKLGITDSPLVAISERICR